ncbi:hypothetical protein NKH47_01760 [Mesorhizobium sp. M1060]|uniref:hypothetical protein n=1 Tax=Mesorhizobium sp. M1060 TaxID=2957052 RepID=UPI003335FC7D
MKKGKATGSVSFEVAVDNGDLLRDSTSQRPAVAKLDHSFPAVGLRTLPLIY